MKNRRGSFWSHPSTPSPKNRRGGDSYINSSASHCNGDELNTIAYPSVISVNPCLSHPLSCFWERGPGGEGCQNDRKQLRISFCVTICLSMILMSLFLTKFEITAAADPTTDIAYILNLENDKHTDSVFIDMQIQVEPGEKIIQVQMPAWSPGDYHIQNHGQYVNNLFVIGSDTRTLRAYDVRWDHPDANTWNIEPNGATILNISYRLKTTPPGIFSENVKISKNEAFFNGPSTFMYVVGHKNRHITLTVLHESSWQIESPFASHRNREIYSGLGEYTALDYDTFADSPILAIRKNSLKTWDFNSDGAKYRAVFFGGETPIYSDVRYQDALKKIVHTENQMMGGPSSLKYIFFFDMNGTGGGLEHLNSTRIALPVNMRLKSFATFVAHEFFHQWNVKRIRPKVLGPFDYINPPRTRNLWFAEGVTEYYAWMCAFRAGLISKQDLLRHFARAISSLEQNPASRTITADEASWKVWESGNSEGFGGLSYYQKGEMIGLCLDLQIRHITHDHSSLDDLMRKLYLQCKPPALGYDEDDILKAANQLTQTYLTPLYNQLARSTSPMPFAESLAFIGLNTAGEPVDHPSNEQLYEQSQWLK